LYGPRQHRSWRGTMKLGFLFGCFAALAASVAVAQEPPRASIDGIWNGSVQAGTNAGQTSRQRIQPVFPRNLEAEAAGRTTHIFVLNLNNPDPINPNLAVDKTDYPVIFWDEDAKRGEVKPYQFNGTAFSYTAIPRGLFATIVPDGNGYLVSGTMKDSTGDRAVAIRLAP
jgi:hypothetical protein